MKRVFIVLIGILVLYSCKPDDRIGYLDVDVRYTGGASQWKLDGVKVAFLRTNTDNLEQASYWIDKTGEQRIELPFGQYKLVLNGNRCKLVDTESIVTINSSEPTPKAIRIQHLGYSVIVTDMGKEKKEGDTIRFEKITALDIKNEYSTNKLHWKAETSTNSWIKFKNEDNGTILGGATGHVLFEIDENNPNFKYDKWNYDKVIITTEDQGTFSVYVGAFKQGDNIDYYPLHIAKIAVQYQDISRGTNHSSAESLCAQSGIGWRLPTIGELSTMWEYKDSIGGFNTTPWDSDYWSSTPRGQSYYYYYNFFADGQDGFTGPSKSCCVRCVRDLK